ncbi:MAG: ABC transporter ATP-binding protein [Planctomycetota bacterium]
MKPIEISSLNKSYGNHQVLRNISFFFEKGKLVGFLGPNGAGKTTTIRILLGLISATSGTATVFGNDVRTHGSRLRSRIGYLPGDVHLYPGMTGRRTLNFFANARRLDCASEIRRLAHVFQLNLDKRVRSYSTGMRQKLGLIQALMHRPELLILDEPTSALDPLIRQSVFSELRKVVDDGRTVLFSSHSLNEVEELCDEVIILRDGVIVEQQRIEVLRQQALRKVTIEFSSPVPDVLPDELTATRITGASSTSAAAKTGQGTGSAKAHSPVAPAEGNVVVGAWKGEMKTLIDWLSHHDVKDVIIERPDLNDLFIAYYSGESGGAV